MKLFLPQATLEGWVIDDKADLIDGKLVDKASNTSFEVTPAVHFAALSSGEDTNKLLGRVKSTSQAEALGAEMAGDAALVGDTAYEVVNGYLAAVPASAAPRGEQKKKPTSPEADLLAAFILDKL